MRLLPLLFLPLLACDFFTPGSGTPADEVVDGVLRCGTTEDVTGFLTGDRLPIEVASTQAFELTLDFDDPTHSGRVRVSSDFGVDRLLEVWIGDARLIPASRVDGGDAELELIALNSGTVSGTITMACPDPSEDCNNIADDDGDGLIDCADPSCAQEPRCVQEQADLEVIELSCGDDLEIAPPAIGTFDEQRVLYAFGDDAVQWHFYGGAEIVLTSTDGPGTVVVEAGSGGLACSGELEATGVQCATAAMLTAGVEATFAAAQLPLWLEPDDAGWTSVRARLDCD